MMLNAERCSVFPDSTVLKIVFFCLLLFEATFTSFFKDKKSKEVTKHFFVIFADVVDPEGVIPEPDPENRGRLGSASEILR